MNDVIALMWDCNGLEAAVNVSELERKRTWAALKNEKGPSLPSLMHWQLRARYNSQRHYEIYLMSVESGVTVDDVIAAFKANPQGMADTVRRIGRKFYSDRANSDEIKII